MNLKETLLEIKSEFTDYFKEREAEINGSLLAVLSGENLLFLGPPGTAKTQLARSICQTIEGGNFFNYLLTSFSTPEEIFGPLSLKALEEDEFRRNIKGCLPTAHIALLDEIFKASSAILNSLLTILNERKYHNGREIVNVPLLSVFGASNELPEEDDSLEALYDRFLFRYRLSYIQDDENFKNLLFKEPDEFRPTASLPVSEIEKLRKSANSLPVDPDVEVIITELRRNLQLQEIEISDRRWKRIVQVLKVAACSSGCPAVDRTMALLLQHMLWNLPEEKETIRKTVFEFVVSGGINTEKLRLDAGDLREAISLALKNDLPVGIACDSCGEKFRFRQEVNAHHDTHPDHSYSFMQEGSSRIYPYDNLIRELDSLYKNSEMPGTIPPARRKVFETEFKGLETLVRGIKKRLGEERQVLRDMMETNIWLSTLDRNEVLLLHDSRYEDLSKIETLVEEIRKMPGLDLLPEKMDTKVQIPGPASDTTSDSENRTGNSAGNFMKGLGSKLGFK
ncbi:AAA family ATPase [Methanosarcina sp. WWM596]|uniref:AAA family ATPase n=1 Tax=Methanosarcina sp. WWM596 TaxID=1434103 RepID=UPI0006158A91|nr:AAA family ATPase [Methanosarcina sp. WWM596]AKB18381.1 MoxR-related protein [Methanosarcina sp. WWM596]